MERNIDEKSLLSERVLKIAHIKASSATSVIISQKTTLRRLLGCLILNCQKTNEETMICSRSYGDFQHKGVTTSL